MVLLKLFLPRPTAVSAHHVLCIAIATAVSLIVLCPQGGLLLLPLLPLPVPLLSLLPVLSLTMLPTASAIAHPEELVNLLAGSFTDGSTFSTGNTLPLVGRPWGFNHWAPQTKDGSRNTGSWWFQGSSSTCPALPGLISINRSATLQYNTAT